ncbi:MAG TPA: SCO family protein [Steroidobacteraceae bacterium]|nr:SCO family protein [Steroidobacteraceae bacterium]
MNARTVLYSLLTLAVLGAAPVAGAPALKAGTFDPPREAPDFSLQSSDGGKLALRDYRGKVVVLGFGFTSCTEVCPVTLATLALAHRKLGAAAAGVQIVYITVDPERDDPAQLKKYLHAFNPTFVGGTGRADELAAVRKNYGVTAEKHGTGSSYTVAHSSFTYLVDRRGKLRALMPYGRAADDYVHDLGILLAE